jgi:hypothetical protein
LPGIDPRVLVEGLICTTDAVKLLQESLGGNVPSGLDDDGVAVTDDVGVTGRVFDRPESFPHRDAVIGAGPGDASVLVSDGVVFES